MIWDLTLSLLCVILVYGFAIWLLMKWDNEQL
jgi:hypothetical protein